MERVRKREISRKIQTDDFEEDLKTVGIRNWHSVATDRKEWKGITLDFKA